jgi:hypothetical protein
MVKSSERSRLLSGHKSIVMLRTAIVGRHCMRSAGRQFSTIPNAAAVRSNAGHLVKPPGVPSSARGRIWSRVIDPPLQQETAFEIFSWCVRSSLAVTLVGGAVYVAFVKVAGFCFDEELILGLVLDEWLRDSRSVGLVSDEWLWSRVIDPPPQQETTFEISCRMSASACDDLFKDPHLLPTVSYASLREEALEELNGNVVRNDDITLEFTYAFTFTRHPPSKMTLCRFCEEISNYDRYLLKAEANAIVEKWELETVLKGNIPNAEYETQLPLLISNVRHWQERQKQAEDVAVFMVLYTWLCQEENSVANVQKFLLAGTYFDFLLGARAFTEVAHLCKNPDCTREREQEHKRPPAKEETK